MPFPYTHIKAAERFLTLQPMNEDKTAAFLLGCLAPDGVHYREGFVGADKKLSHLCPVSGEKWGRITENDKWLGLVKDYYTDNGTDDPFILGYCFHIVTDIVNNRDLFMEYWKNNPQDAAKGYQSERQKEWEQIDSRLYQESAERKQTEALLTKGTARDMPGLVSAEEINALRHNIIHVSYPN
jgi:hypothetical protein